MYNSYAAVAAIAKQWPFPFLERVKKSLEGGNKANKEDQAIDRFQVLGLSHCFTLCVGRIGLSRVLLQTYRLLDFDAP